MNAPILTLRELVEQVGEDAAVDAGGWPAPLDLAALAQCEPHPPRHIIPGWLPCGEVTLLAGHGGAGKSAIALHLAACIASGLAWHGLATERRRVLYVSAEDGAEVLHWRLSRISAHLGVSLAELAGRIEIIDASHMDCELMVETRDEPILTAAYMTLRERVRPGMVLILDGASDLYGSNENARVHVRRYIRALRRLIDPDGAMLLLAHVDKASARNGTESDRYSGSTAWHNSVRARWSLTADGEGLVLTVAKANHALAGAELRLRWDSAAHMHVADQAPADGGIVASIRERQEREGILATMRECAAAGLAVPSATSGRRTSYHVLASQPSFPEALRGDSRAVHGRFWRHIEALRQCGTLRECSIRTPGRKWVGVLTLATEEARQCANAAAA